MSTALLIHVACSFFVSPDGETPSEDELRRLMSRLKEVDKKQQSQEDQQQNAASATSTSSVASPSTNLPPVTDSPVGITEWPPVIAPSKHR